jgi:hypothetical protein
MTNMLQQKAKLEQLHEICMIIEDAIHENHRILCFSDGDMTNHDNRNTFYLHICDILNVMVKKGKIVFQ